MRLSRRQVVSSLLAAAFPAVARAATSETVNDVLADLATALSQGEAAAFLGHIDKNMPGYARLQTLVWALVGAVEVGCSAEILHQEGDEHKQTAEIDWILELTTNNPPGPIERREKTVHCTFELHGKHWVVTALDPIDFFAPPQSSHS